MQNITEAANAAADQLILQQAHAEGYAAYNENRPAAPTLSPVIRTLVGDRAVGTGAAEIYAAFTAGYNQAADDECARILAD